MAIPQVGCSGLAIVVTFKDQNQNVIDLSPLGVGTATSIYLRRPNGRVTSHIAAFLTDGTDGRVVYHTTLGDIDVPGDWWIQARVVNTVTPDDLDFFTDVQPFRVAENIAPERF
jgi:hypothetical protein